LDALFPERGELAVEDVYAGLRLEELAPPDRPYVVANMIASVDGRATLGGRSGGLGNEADRQIFLDLRTQVDAVMAGAATIGVERYGPLVKSAERRAIRVGRGLEPVPLAVTATRTMELPAQAPLFSDPESRIVVLTNSDREAPACAAAVSVERLKGEPLELLAGMELLRSRYGVRSLLLEGGPTLLAAMMAAGAVHELLLTRAPKIVGRPDERSILEGSALEGPLGLELLSVLREGAYLFLRYRLGTSD
jgi:riboflavin biosynthesis pyrimidine reductase